MWVLSNGIEAKVAAIPHHLDPRRLIVVKDHYIGVVT